MYFILNLFSFLVILNLFVVEKFDLKNCFFFWRVELIIVSLFSNIFLV